MKMEDRVPVRFGGDVRRVTDLQVHEGSEGRTAIEIATTGRIGVFEGVHIDFRPPQLPADEWWARPWWHVFGDGEAHCGLVFPGEAAASKAVWNETKGDVRRQALYAMPGDRLTIARVAQVDEASKLHHPHDYSVRKAYLRLTRADGSVEEGIGPLAFYGKTRIMHHGSREAFDNAIDRIAALEPAGLQWPDVFDESRRPTWGNGAEAVAKYHAAQAHDDLFALLDALAPDDHSARAQLRSLANSALLAGFALAKHEASRAEHWDAVRKANAAKGGEATRNDDWRDAAKSLWRDEPTLSTNAVATRLVNEMFNDSEVSSIARAIRYLAPPTSSSHKPDKYQPWV